MISIGVDLAGLEKNPTGFCVLKDRVAKTFILHTDNEIVENVKKIKPDVVAVDAPVVYPPKIRECDKILKKYGAMPPTMKSMSILSKRGFFLAKKLKDFNVIEVFPTGSAKILGVYSKDVNVVKKKLLNLRLKIESSISTKDEIDSVIAALTGILHLHNLTEKIGDKEGFVICPKPFILNKHSILDVLSKMQIIDVSEKRETCL